ncbi:MAG: glutathione S-transferase family protein [Candidatus Binataceae bacterium]
MHTLYWSPGACSIAPHIVLEEIGEPYRTERVLIEAQGTAEVLVPSAYLKVNPKGRLPALTIEGQILTEAPAIMMYLARSNPEAGLLPHDAEGEARVYEWMNYLTTTVHAVAFGQVVRPQRFVEDPADFPKVIAKGRQNVAKAYTFIESQLRGREWAAAGQYSLADIYLLFFYLGSKAAGNPMERAFPAWSGIAERTLARPAVQRVLRQEGASLAA